MSSARSVPVGNGMTWLVRGFRTVRKHPGTLSIAMFLLVLAILVPVGIQLAAQFLLAGTSASIAIQLLATLAMVFIASLMMIGLLRLIDTLERTGSGQASSIFAAFSDTDLMVRAVTFALIVFVASMAFVVALLLTLGPDMLGWYRNVLTEPLGAAAAAAPPITGSPWLSAAVGLVGALALFGINTFGYAQVALTRARGGEAFMDGLHGTARNVLPILLNIVVVVIAIFAMVIPLVLLMMLFGFIGGLVHPLAGMVLIMPLYVAFMIALYALIFATMYHAWRDVFGDTATTAVEAVPSPSIQA